MDKRLTSILACPIDNFYPLELFAFQGTDEAVEEGAFVCSRCNRYFPIVQGIPIMLPDELRSKDIDSSFLAKYGAQIPERVRKS